MKQKNRILPAFLTVLAAVVMLSLPLTACDRKDTAQPDRSDIEARLKELDQERKTLVKMIKNAALPSPDPVCVLCFDGACLSLAENAFPMLSEAGYPAAVAVRDGTLPGQPGMITADQAAELVKAGWEFIPSGSADIPVVSDGALNPDWTADLDATLAAFAALGLPAPSCYAFAPDSYNPLADSALSERSITVALHRWSSENRESGLKALGLTLFGGSVAGSGPVYRIGGATVVAGASSAQLDVQNACAENAVVAVCTGQLLEEVPPEEESVSCTVSKYSLVLQDLTAYGEEYGLRVMTFSAACAYKRDFEDSLDEQEAEYEEFCRKANERIAEIDGETSVLLEQMLK